MSKALSKLNLFTRWSKSNAAQSGVTLFVSKHVLYLAHTHDQNIACKPVAVEGGDWTHALHAAVDGLDVKGSDCKIVLGSEYYQSYQIDTPKVPKEEWPVALPFLLKDVIAERISDVVVDAVELPTRGKSQAYVIKKAQLEQLKAACESQQLILSQVVPDNEVWAKVPTEQDHYLLLHRAQKENFAVAAITDNKTVFQRGIRGIVAPLTSSPAGGLQFDSLALEVQRSVDYLSASFKQVHFNHLFVVCDEEDTPRLLEELNSRLSVNVAALPESWESVGELLTKTATSNEFDVNLYPDHLRPKRELFTLATTLVCWALLSLMILGSVLYYNYQKNQIDKKWVSVEQQVTALASEQARLQQRLSQHVATKSKLDAAERLEKDIEAKRVSLSAVGRFDESQRSGFSGVMSALANIDRDDVALSAIYISADKLSFEGLAKDPASVPSWLKEFKQEVNLVGRSFESLNIGRNEDGVVTFKIDSKAGKK
jgi:MSHA biogenesis protein MshI